MPKWKLCFYAASHSSYLSGIANKRVCILLSQQVIVDVKWQYRLRLRYNYMPSTGYLIMFVWKSAILNSLEIVPTLWAYLKFDPFWCSATILVYNQSIYREMGLGGKIGVKTGLGGRIEGKSLWEVNLG